MHAVVQHEFGPPEVLRYEEVPDVGPGPGQVRIAVTAAGVHLVDTTIRSGEPGPFPKPGLPFVGGREVAGVVDAVGPDTDVTWVGRRVVAHLGMASGGYATLAVVAAASLHALPDGVSDAEAVAMIGTGRTAMAILDVAALTADDTVLVTSAAGGLGVLLVQAALAVGATVIGAAGGPEKADLVRSLAAQAADYDVDGWADGLGPVSVVLDGVGGDRGRAALERLQPGGRAIFYGWSAGEPTPLSVYDLVRLGITASAAIGARIAQRPGGLRGFEEQSLAALAAGTLRPLTTTFPLAEAAAAHEALKGRDTTGKVVLTP